MLKKTASKATHEGKQNRRRIAVDIVPTGWSARTGSGVLNAVGWRARKAENVKRLKRVGQDVKNSEGLVVRQPRGLVRVPTKGTAKSYTSSRRILLVAVHVPPVNSSGRAYRRTPGFGHSFLTIRTLQTLTTEYVVFFIFYL